MSEKDTKTTTISLQQFPASGQVVKRLAIAGLNWLEANKQTVNALNVFPVPDGDTGTNMVLTMRSAVDAIKDSGDRHVGNILNSLADGALLGARGNSGVILSQIWRGFARANKESEYLDAQAFIAGFASARDAAYRGVVKPVEGTILTVTKDIAEAVSTVDAENVDALGMLEKAVEAAAKSVEHTPELLPILKDAGVVDSGGKGLFFILEGMLRWINGQQIQTAESIVQPLAALNLESTMEAVEEGQDYEIVVDFKPSAPLDLQAFYAELEKMGTSIQVGEGDDMYRMHIHVPTDMRYVPIDYTMTLGTVTNVAIENLMAQMDEIGEQAGALNLAIAKPEHIAVVAVAPGRGLARHFAELGVAAVIEGGQTMNPSTKDILSAFEDLPSDQIIILPNNKNITMAANAVQDLTVKKVAIIPTSTAPQGLAAMLSLVPDGDFDKVVANMNAAITEVQTGEVTTATRDVEIDGVNVKSGQIIGLHNGKLVISETDLETACLNLLEIIGTIEHEVITLFYGENVNQEQAEQIASAIEKKFPEDEVEVQKGGQPHYQFIFSVE